MSLDVFPVEPASYVDDTAIVEVPSSAKVLGDGVGAPLVELVASVGEVSPIEVVSSLTADSKTVSEAVAEVSTSVDECALVDVAGFVDCVDDSKSTADVFSLFEVAGELNTSAEVANTSELAISADDIIVTVEDDPPTPSGRVEEPSVEDRRSVSTELGGSCVSINEEDMLSAAVVTAPEPDNCSVEVCAIVVEAGPSDVEGEFGDDELCCEPLVDAVSSAEEMMELPSPLLD